MDQLALRSTRLAQKSKLGVSITGKYKNVKRMGIFETFQETKLMRPTSISSDYRRLYRLKNMLEVVQILLFFK